jgi:DtxR family transcriptional regulator, Mn-dependent transcriptional regulator
MLPSSTVENYLKAIYLGTSGRPEERLLAMGRLASALGVAPGTATTMVKTLAESGLVEYEPYAGVRLTRAGERLAALVLRRHRLIELFLVQVMGLQWDEVHEDAEQLEHVVSERLVDRMDQMLGRPEVDPHGDPIPDAEGVVKMQEAQTLLTCPLRTTVKVTRVLDQDKAFLRFIERHDLKPGQPIEVESRDAAADSVCLRGKNDARVTIGTGAASKLLVQIARAMLLVLAVASTARAQAARPFEIIDNSFLIEEAFNQEEGIVQTIGTFRMDARSEWETSITQEWPLLGRTHQVSYSIPYAATSGARGVGDVMLNYRVQLMLDARGTPAFSPRISLIVPTGDSARGLGEGGLGWQVNLPFSKQAGDTYLHWNVGFTQIPSASGPDGDHDVARAHAGASAIWRLRPMVNLMMETLVEGTTRVTLSPGVRVGWNRDASQWVIGIAAPLVREDAATTLSGLGYLSYEFPFNP